MPEHSDFVLDPTKTNAENAAEFAAHKAKSAQMAAEISREVHQQELVGQTKDAVREVFHEVFGKLENTSEADSNMLVKRIPFICIDIKQIQQDNTASAKDIAEIKDNIKWGVRLALGALVTGLVAILFTSLT